MNSTLLRQNILDVKFTDVELVLTDPTNSVSLRVHKIILASCSEYFQKLFSFGDCNKIVQEIQVPNASVTKDIIMSFYGIMNDSLNCSKWYSVLQMLKCRNFLCLDLDVTMLYNLVVPVEGFELLLDVLELFDLCGNQQLVNLVKNNLPPNYDLSIFSSGLIEKFAKKPLVAISGLGDTDVKIFSLYTNEIVNFIDLNLINCINVLRFSHNNEMIVFGSDDIIYVYDIIANKMIQKFTDHVYASCIEFSHNDKLFVSGNEDNCNVKLWDIASGELLTCWRHIGSVTKVAFSHDDKLVISSDYTHIKICDTSTGNLLCMIGESNELNESDESDESDESNFDESGFVLSSDDKLFVLKNNSIRILDIHTGILVGVSPISSIIHKFPAHYSAGIHYSHSMSGHSNAQLSISHNDQLILYYNHNVINILNAETGNLIHILHGHFYRIARAEFTDDDQTIISCDERCIINLWDVSTGKLINTLDKHENEICSAAFSH